MSSNPYGLAPRNRPKNDPRSGQPPREWFEQHWDEIHCLSMNMAEFTFAAARALASYGDGSGYWLKAAWDGAMAVGAILNCYPPPYEEVERYVGVVGLQCQCAEDPGTLILQWLDYSGDQHNVELSGSEQAKKIISKDIDKTVARCTYEDANGEQVEVQHDFGSGYNVKFFINPPAGSLCCDGEEPPTPSYGQPVPHPAPVQSEYYRYEAELRDAVIDKFGYLRNFYIVRIYDAESGIEYPPDFYWESIDGPIWYADDSNLFEGFSSIPEYGPPHRDRVRYSDQPGGGSNIPGLNEVKYPLDVGCTWNEEEQKYDEVYEYPVEYNADGIVGLARRLDAVAWLINEANLIPYRACADVKPCLEGTWISTRWESDSPSPGGTKPLRKLLRYRSKSDRDAEELREYWSDFEWKAGPVCVIHKGAWWGTPQVWAESKKEGKRVLRRAAREAGLDPDQVGEWIISSSNSPRYGMTGTMRLEVAGGVRWVTRRDGPSGPAI